MRIEKARLLDPTCIMAVSLQSSRLILEVCVYEMGAWAKSAIMSAVILG